MPVLYIGIPLIAVIVLNLQSWGNKRSVFYAVIGAAALQTLMAGIDILRLLNTPTPIASDFFGHFEVDLFAAVVLFIIGMITAITDVVARATVEHSRFSFGNALLLLMMGMNGVVMVQDVFSLYVFIEVTSTSAFLLIAINKKKNELEGAFKYYLMSALATAMMLLAITLLFTLAGGTSYGMISDYVAGLRGVYPAALSAAFILFIAALCIKSGVVPFHSWVPDAHSSAPSSVSIIMAGIVIKVSGVYALMRVYHDVFLSNAQLGRALMVFGLVSIVAGALGAIGQKDLKRMLAFSSVSQIGYIVLGVATGSSLGYMGAIMHFFNHATFKSLLFVDAAAVLKQTGTRNMDEMGGLAKKMPYTGISSVIGLLSMAGIPPLSGFWSKLVIVMALFKVSSPLAIGTLLTSALTLAYFLILQKKVFFGEVPPNMENVTEAPRSLRVVQVFLSAVNIVAGLLFPLILIFLNARGMF